MIFHPNPMVDLKSGIWEDSHLKVIVVKRVLINNSKNPVRWVVFRRNSRNVLLRVSPHITMEKAVVEAQTLANRLYKQHLSNKRKAKKSPRKALDTATLTAQRDRIMTTLSMAFDDAIAGNRQSAQLLSQEVNDFIKKHFV